MSSFVSSVGKSLLAGAFLGASFLVSPALADPDAPANKPEVEQTNDPFEDVNRVTHGFNRLFRGIILDPLVDGYKAVTPEPLQEGISNVVSNLSEPVTALSSVLAGDMDNASAASKRFFVNTTMGLGGLSDPASEMGLEQRPEDLGQAAAVNGAEEGPYIVLPFLGPSNSRDLAGSIATSLINPLPLAGQLASGGVEYTRYKDDINDMTSGSLDPYAVERSAFRQHRNYLISNGKELDLDIPVFTDNEDFSGN